MFFDLPKRSYGASKIEFYDDLFLTNISSDVFALK